VREYGRYPLNLGEYDLEMFTDNKANK
jgi:hypothetical protein